MYRPLPVLEETSDDLVGRGCGVLVACAAVVEIVEVEVVNGRMCREPGPGPHLGVDGRLNNRVPRPTDRVGLGINDGKGVDGAEREFRMGYISRRRSPSICSRGIFRG